MNFNTIPEALEDLRQGKIILVTDDPDRENEGDFICAAEFATTENINFMATHGKGLICMPMSEAFVRKLQFPQMVQNNTDNHETAFTVSIDHISTSTGISAAERSVTAMACVEESWLRSYSRPMVSISGSAARIRFMMAAVFRASEVPVMFLSLIHI